MKKLTFEQKKMKSFTGKRFTGSIVSIKKHHQRSMVIAGDIYEHFGVHVYQYQQKHLLWFISEYLKNFAKGTRYNYFLTIKRIIRINRKSSCWEPFLQKYFDDLEVKYKLQIAISANERWL